MKAAFLIILLLLSVSCVTKAQTFDTYEIERFRTNRDKSFRNANETPLTKEDFANFKGLEYFDANEKFIVKAKFEKTSDAQIFMMPTSIGTTRRYLKYGVLTFELDGKSFSLTAFKRESAKKNTSLFVPFRDLTNGAETYGAGRYLDIRIPSGDEVNIDFNRAYNANCAYGSNEYSCPVPPRENFLQVKILAGEKKFPSSAKKQ
jgi:uncharacterized protein